MLLLVFRGDDDDDGRTNSVNFQDYFSIIRVKKVHDFLPPSH